MHDPAHPTCDVLLVSELPLWPLDRGFRVHGVNMLRSLRDAGLNVAATTLRHADEPMPGWLSEVMLDWPVASSADVKRYARGWQGSTQRLRHKVASHQALNPSELAGLLTLIEQHRPAAVLAVGQHGPAILRGLSWAYPTLPRIWYAADEPVSFQLSLLRREGLSTLRQRTRLAIVFGLMQTLFNRGNRARRLDAAIGVSPRDTRLLSLIGGCQAVTIRNGVDTDHFQPNPAISPLPRSCVFWGDLSFEPNVDAVRWFVRKVWRQMVYSRPDATFTIMGRNPCEAVMQLADEPGIELLPNVPDLRPHLSASGAALLPMRCGHGIKNKLLEAAAMGMPILASPRAVSGLAFGEGRPPLMVCRSTQDWFDALRRVWDQPQLASATGALARRWVMDRHSWPAAASQMQDLLQTLAPNEPIYIDSQAKHSADEATDQRDAA